MVQASEPPRGYTIAAVSKLTGVSCHALRAWERRYGFPVPHRSGSGHRRYDADQVQLIRRVAAAVHSGGPVGDLIARARSGELEPAPECALPAPVEAAAGVAGLVDRLIAGDVSGADRAYARLAEGLGPEALVGRVFEPGFIEVGDRWFRGECAIGQERCASEFLATKLHALIEAARRANPASTRRVILGTVQGDRHEGGVLMASLLLEWSGWRVQRLGTDVPVREYADAVVRWRPDAVGVSFVLSRNINKRFAELARVRSVPVFVGGRSIVNYQGLARRHGLIPLPGPATATVPQFLREMERRLQPG